jgi:ABC-type multidrug transport system ATPase subunit
LPPGCPFTPFALPRILGSTPGDITVNGVPAGASNHKQAYVEQSDNFYTMLTLSETLHTTGQLQLPPDLPGADKDKAINRLISVLGLSKVRWSGGGGGRGAA